MTFTDPICEVSGYSRCNKSDQCYESTKDQCDEFNDCGNGYDESLCGISKLVVFITDLEIRIGTVKEKKKFR